MANRWALSSRKVLAAANLPHKVLGGAQVRVNQLANPPIRGKAPTRAGSAKPGYQTCHSRRQACDQRQWCQASSKVILLIGKR